MSALDAYALRSPIGGRAFALRAAIGLTGDGAAERTGWVHVAYEGEWNGHPDGAFTLDSDAFRSCIAAFDDQVNPIKVDYEHSSVENTHGQPAPSAGYVQRLELRDDGLWALVEFTKRAASMIRDGEYRFCSGVFVFDGPHRKSGDAVPCFIHSIALTDTPFIDGQRPIALSARRVALAHGDMMKITREAFMAALEALEGDEFDASQLHALVEGAESLAAAAEPAEEAEAAMADEPAEEPAKDGDKGDAEEAAASAAVLDADAPALTDGDAPADGGDAAELLAQFAEVAAMMELDVPGLLAMLREQAAGMSDAENPAALSEQVGALKASVATLSDKLRKYEEREAKEAKAAIEAEVDALVKRGVVRLADRPKFVKLAHKDLSSFREIVSTMAPTVPVGSEASAEKPPESEAGALDMTDENVRALRVHLAGYGLSEEAIKRRLSDHFTGRLGRSIAG